MGGGYVTQDRARKARGDLGDVVDAAYSVMDNCRNTSSLDIR